MKEEKLWAMPDEGYCDGDSGYYYPTSLVPYKKDETFEQVVAKVRKFTAKNYGCADDDPIIDEDLKELNVVMIITTSTKKLINAGLPSGSCGGDSETYMINRSCKQMCKKAALKILRRKK